MTMLYPNIALKQYLPELSKPRQESFMD